MENRKDTKRAGLFLIFAVLILLITIGVKLLHTNNSLISFLPSLLALILLIVETFLEYKTSVFKNSKKHLSIIYWATVVVTWAVIIIC